MFRFALIVAAAVLIAGCSSIPYSAKDKSQEQTMADFTDCYSKADLEANTPPYPADVKAAVSDKTNACMAERGYKKRFF